SSSSDSPSSKTACAACSPRATAAHARSDATSPGSRAATATAHSPSRSCVRPWGSTRIGCDVGCARPLGSPTSCASPGADMLHLASSTGRAWLARALTHLDDVLVDHAHREKKAASTAVSLLFRYPERAELLGPLARLARDELRHFEQVVDRLRARGIPLRRQRPSPYASELLAAVRPVEPERLLDTLLCMALIEARSCERLQLLADAVPDGDLAALFTSLLASEARHHRAYVDLAERIAPASEVQARLGGVGTAEAARAESRP